MKTLLFMALIGASIQSHASVLSCYVKSTHEPFVTIHENVPSNGYATLKSPNGSTALVHFSNKLEKSLGGCFYTATNTKKFVHPYYSLTVATHWNGGQPNTRCAGSDEPLKKIYTGLFQAEMQSDKTVVCYEK